MRRTLQPGRFFGRALHSRRVGDLVLVDSRHAAGTRLPRHTHEHAYQYRDRYSDKHAYRYTSK